MFNEWLLNQLRERDWTQADLARQSRLTRSAISNYVNGRMPDNDSLVKIGKAFDLTPDQIFEVAGIIPSKRTLTSLQ